MTHSMHFGENSFSMNTCTSREIYIEFRSSTCLIIYHRHILYIDNLQPVQYNVKLLKVFYNILNSAQMLNITHGV